MATYKPTNAPPPILDDLFHIQRWMCSRCGLIFDFEFGLGPGEPGWMDVDPPIDQWNYIDVDRETEFRELCPRCGTSFYDVPLSSVLVRETKDLSDFFKEGDVEGEILEFKEKFATDGIRETIAAFATCQGGRIILGVTKKGIPVGYDEEPLETTEGKERLQQRVRGLLGLIQPQVNIRIYFVDDQSSLHYAIIEVPKGASPLYSANGKYYIRHLDETRQAKPEEIIALIGRYKK